MDNQNIEQELAAEESAIMADAAKEDNAAGLEVDTPVIDDVEPQEPDTSTVDSDNSDTSTETLVTDKGEPIKEGSAIPESEVPKGEDDAPKGEAEDTKKEEESKPLTKYEKAKAREAKAWQKIEGEKKELAEEKAAWEKERADTEANKTEKTESKKPPTAKEYNELADWYEDEGKFDQAERAREAAKQAESQEVETKALDINKQQAKFQNDWNDNVKLMRDENPDMDDPKSELAKAVEAQLDSDPRFSNIPDGVNLAVRLAKAELAGTRIADLKKEIGTLKEENKSLIEKTSIGPSGANERNASPSRKNMSLEQEEAELLKLARKDDIAAGVY